MIIMRLTEETADRVVGSALSAVCVALGVVFFMHDAGGLYGLVSLAACAGFGVMVFCAVTGCVRFEVVRR